MNKKVAAGMTPGTHGSTFGETFGYGSWKHRDGYRIK